uniref:Uncharacterized protein n=1 Tax=Romanomermis culicivorax TaxID=13658 RepID=A0A915IH48_ROMCU
MEDQQPSASLGSSVTATLTSMRPPYPLTLLAASTLHIRHSTPARPTPTTDLLNSIQNNKQNIISSNYVCILIYYHCCLRNHQACPKILVKFILTILIKSKLQLASASDPQFKIVLCFYTILVLGGAKSVVSIVHQQDAIVSKLFVYINCHFIIVIAIPYHHVPEDREQAKSFLGPSKSRVEKLGITYFWRLYPTITIGTPCPIKCNKTRAAKMTNKEANI